MPFKTADDLFSERICEIAEALSTFVTRAKEIVATEAVSDPANQVFLLGKPLTQLVRRLEQLRHSTAEGSQFGLARLGALEEAIEEFRAELDRLA